MFATAANSQMGAVVTVNKYWVTWHVALRPQPTRRTSWKL